MDWMGRVRGIMGMVHVVAMQGARWAWEEEQEEQCDNEDVMVENEDEEKEEEAGCQRLGEVVEAFGLQIPYKQPVAELQDQVPAADCPLPAENLKNAQHSTGGSHYQKARQGFHTSRLFRDRVPESPFQDRALGLDQKLSGYLSNGPGSGGSDEPLLRGASGSLPRIVVFSPDEPDGQEGRGENFSTAKQKVRYLTPSNKARSMEERSSSNQSRIKMKRNSSMSQMKALVSDSIDEMVKVAEVTKPVMIMKAAMETVTFKREDNIKREMDLAVKEGKYFKEDLSLEHFNRLKDAFNHHDQGVKGFLTKSELRSCLRTLGHNPTEQEMWRFMAQVDVDHSGTLDFEEFFSLMSSMMSGWDPQSDLGACWTVLDPAGKGRVKLKDLVYLLKTFGAMVPDDEIEEMFEGFDDIEEIDFNQFLEAIVGTR